jgi:hypothetical protein
MAAQSWGSTLHPLSQSFQTTLTTCQRQPAQLQQVGGVTSHGCCAGVSWVQHESYHEGATGQAPVLQDFGLQIMQLIARACFAVAGSLLCMLMTLKSSMCFPGSWLAACTSSLPAGTLSGALFRSPRGPRQAAAAGLVGAAGGLAVAALRTVFPSL